jgi:hypothetical protein
VILGRRSFPLKIRSICSTYRHAAKEGYDVGARGRLIAAGLGCFLVLAGGAAFVTGIIHLPINCEGPSLPPWDDPYRGHGIQVADLKEAAPYLAFTPVVPRALGPAAKFFISGNQPDMSAKELIWVYDQPVYGRFWVEESIAETTQASIDSLGNNPTGCSVNSLVTLRGGIRAAVLAANPEAHGSGTGTTSITWLDHGLLISALGFTYRFTKDHAIEVANQISGKI